MQFVHRNKGTCSSEIRYDIEDNIIKDLEIVGGCPGNTKGVAKLCIGKTVDEVIELLLGIPCGMRETSCPDQLAKGLIEYKKEMESK
jgi:uncharacterized protein (TIGR03905 family)